jgi:hypothetical protein
MERFFRSFKTEWMPEVGYQYFAEAEISIINHIIGYYSSVRPHQHNNGQSPNEVERDGIYRSNVTAKVVDVLLEYVIGLNKIYLGFKK